MAIKTLDTSGIKFIDAYDHAAEYKQYDQNALAIFALSIYLRIDDVEGFALNAISDGADDKTIDICYFDEEEGYAVIAQSYFSEKWGKEAANLKKARDINTGIAWLLSANEVELPIRLRNKAIELRNAIKQGTIHRIEIFYIHNCFESKNVDDELKTTANAADNLVKTKNPNVDNPINVSYKEMGLNSIEEIFQSREKEILIDDWIDVPINQYIQEQNASWKAIVAIVPCAWVRSLYNNHG
ncbi:MAG: hypothetical protein ACYDH2_10910, partial [Anaerolineaceae bacterium]